MLRLVLFIDRKNWFWLGETLFVAPVLSTISTLGFQNNMERNFPGTGLEGHVPYVNISACKRVGFFDLNEEGFIFGWRIKEDKKMILYSYWSA